MNESDRSRCVSCGRNIPDAKSEAMKDSIFERYKRLDQAMLDKLEGDKQAKGVSIAKVDKIKKQTNMFIWLLRELPRLENTKGSTFRALLK